MKNDWMHVYSSNDITLKFLHRTRGKAAIEAINIKLIGYPGWLLLFRFRPNRE
ncbi:hypothetical protein [Nitrosomonas communis]|uniref:Uncharacterized protein n=1 Tax=Nitrosomonas communis TaxID=44574 RepID=A0A1I4JYK4_9PROT|nr:hypothetical protein SAMN05421863_100334 [Nitrosomonas communis]